MNRLEYNVTKPTSAALTPYIETFLQVSGVGTSPFKYILPRPGASLAFVQQGRYYNKNLFLTSALAGFHCRPYSVHSEGSRVDCFAVRFTAVGLSRFTSRSCDNFTDKIIDPCSVWPDLPELIMKLYVAGSLDKRVSLMEEFLLAKLITPTETDSKIFHLVESILSNSDGQSLEKMKTAVPLCLRQLQRIFKKITGSTLKMFTSVARFDQARRLMHDEISLTRLAHQINYFDQPHFSNEFKKMSGVRPTNLIPCSDGRLG